MMVVVDVLGTLLFTCFSLIMTHTLVKSVKDGRVYFQQGRDLTKRKDPKRFRRAVRYHFLNVLIFDIGSALAFYKYIICKVFPAFPSF